MKPRHLPLLLTASLLLACGDKTPVQEDTAPVTAAPLAESPALPPSDPAIETLRRYLVGADVSSQQPFRRLIDTQMLERLRHQPQALTALGMIENTEDDQHSGMLDDTSPRSLARERNDYARWRDELLAVDRSALEGQHAITYDIALELYERAMSRAEFPYAVDLVDRVTFAIEHMQGPQTSLPRFMEAQHRVEDLASAERYIMRLRAFAPAFDGKLAQAQLQRNAGVLPPRFVMEHVLHDARVFIEPAPADNPLVQHLRDKLAALPGIDAETRGALLSNAAAAMEAEVYPAFRKLITQYDAWLPEASNDGVWSLPDGEAYYATMLRSETSTDLTPQEIHDWGVAEVARIEAEMDAILQGEGLTEGTPGERTATLGRDPAHLFSNDDAGRAELIKYLEDLLADMTERQKPYFAQLPRVGVVVQRVPEFAEARQTIAYYGPVSMDGKRPGVYFINLRDTRDMPRWSLPSLTYHEAIPGHHFQTSIMQEIEDLPLLRRRIGMTAYREGWALYAEYLAYEMGVYDGDPLGNLGRLQYEMWRAVRMVVDTGIHTLRWSREQAIEYFMAKTGMSEMDATVEVERYFVLPGNAPAYKLGMLKILELREKAEARLGDDFDIAEFHQVVLRNGPMPLVLLERVVGEWLDGLVTSA